MPSKNSLNLSSNPIWIKKPESNLRREQTFVKLKLPRTIIVHAIHDCTDKGGISFVSPYIRRRSNVILCYKNVFLTNYCTYRNKFQVQRKRRFKRATREYRVYICKIGISELI